MASKILNEFFLSFGQIETEVNMKRGDILELIEDTTFYKKGKKAYFIGRSNTNPNNIEIVWVGEEQTYKDGDIDEYPTRLFKQVQYVNR